MTKHEIAAVQAQIRYLDVLYKALYFASSARHQACAAGVNKELLTATDTGIDLALLEVQIATSTLKALLPVLGDAP